MSNLLKSSNSYAGSDLNKVMFSFIEIKDVLYQTLMNIEINRIKEKWG